MEWILRLLQEQDCFFLCKVDLGQNSTATEGLFFPALEMITSYMDCPTVIFSFS